MGSVLLEGTASAAQASDRPLTFEALVERHVDDVHRIVARLLGPHTPRSDHEDVCQEVFLELQRAFPRFRGDSRTSTWLYGVTVRTVLHELRSWRRRRRLREAVEAARAVVAAPSMERALEQRDEVRRVERALLTISPKKRVVWLLFEVEGWTGPEIAAALEVPEATVWTRLYHARRELLSALGEEDR